jgi:hypothetical protein
MVLLSIKLPKRAVNLPELNSQIVTHFFIDVYYASIAYIVKQHKSILRVELCSTRNAVNFVLIIKFQCLKHYKQKTTKITFFLIG